MKKLCLLLLPVLMLCACRHARKVNTSFYYWKTVYHNSAVESAYLHQLHTQQIYVRLMDVDADADGRPVPVSPVTFADSLPRGIKIVPVVFIVNNLLRQTDTVTLSKLASNITSYADIKLKEAGISGYGELQIDCDWTATTRDNYFYLLRSIGRQPQMKGKQLSVTLRLHQLKNLQNCGVPPADRVMLMCYNMGNLRKLGRQNSILELDELKKYAGKNLEQYLLKTDIGLPIFSWAVAFRNNQYIGISKSINRDSLGRQQNFRQTGDNQFVVLNDLPQFGLEQHDAIRWESVSTDDLNSTARYLSANINTDSLSVIYFHLDQALLKQFPANKLQDISNLFR